MAILYWLKSWLNGDTITNFILGYREEAYDFVEDDQTHG